MPAAARVMVMPEGVARDAVAVSMASEVACQTPGRCQSTSMRREMAMSGEVLAAKPMPVMALRKMTAVIVPAREVMAREMVAPCEMMAEVPSAKVSKMMTAEVASSKMSKVAATKMMTTKMAAPKMSTAKMSAAKVPAAKVPATKVPATEMSSFSR